MNWDARHNPIETFVEWAAPALLAVAVGWAAWAVGADPAVAAVALAAAMTAGVVLIRRLAGEPMIAPPRFEPVSFEESCPDELLLDDPLVPIGDDSRVVRLFDNQPRTPGEMVARISDFLEVRPPAPRLAAAAGEAEPPHRPTDASAALHEALASIRASFR